MALVHRAHGVLNRMAAAARRPVAALFLLSIRKKIAKESVLLLDDEQLI